MNANRYEWWYLHFVTPSLGVSMVFHQTDIFGHAKTPYMSLSYSTGDGRRAYHRANLSEDPLEVEAKLLIPGVLVESESQIDLCATFDTAKITGTIEKLSCPIAVNKGLLFQDTDGTQSDWIVHVPHARFKGRLVDNGVETEIDAHAYFDHQFGSIPIQDFLREWVWGVYSNNEETHGFFRIVTNRNQIIDRGFACTSTRHECSTTIREDFLHQIASVAEPKNARFFPTIEINDVRLTPGLSPDSLVRERMNETHDTFIFDYLRWFGAESGGRVGFTEFMRIRR